MTNAPAPESRRHGPAIPRWMLPSVRVGRRGDVITIEQRVPARVEGIHTSSGHDSSSIHDEYRTPIYEAGLGSPTSVPLVKERLTVPASAVSEQQVRQAVDHAIAAYDPGTGARCRGCCRPSPHWAWREPACTSPSPSTKAPPSHPRVILLPACRRSSQFCPASSSS